MRIPLVGVPEPTTPERTFTPLDTDTYAKVGRAGAEFGNALQGIGDLGFRIKHAYDDAAVTKIATSAEAAKTDAINSLTSSLDPKTGLPDPQNNDPTTYAERWEQAKQHAMDAAQNDPMGKGMLPEAQVRLKVALSGVFARGDAEVRGVTREKMLQVAGAVNDVAMKGMVMAGQEDQAQALAAKQVATGEKNPEWGAQQKIAIPQQVDQNAAIHLMTTDVKLGGGPFVAQDKLEAKDSNGKFVNFTRLLPEQRQELLRQSSYDGRILQQQTADKYNQYIASGQPIDLQEAKNDLLTRTLTRTTYNALTKPHKPVGDDPQGYVQLMGKINQLDPTNRDYASEYEVGRDINNLTGFNQENAKQLFKEKMNPRSQLNTPTAKYGFDVIESGLSKNVFGKYEEPAEAPSAANGFTGKKASLNESAYQSAVQRQAGTQSAFTDWLRDPKNLHATPADAAKFIYGFQSNQVRQGASSILGGKPQSAPPDLDALIKRYSTAAP